MAETRTDLEQQALRWVTRGQIPKAIDVYRKILARDPHDRRIRQKVGELYLKIGREAEGLKSLKEAADLTLKDGQARAAIALYKVLQGHLPEDLGVMASLAECYRQAGMSAEAERTAEETLNLAVSGRNWKIAVAMVDQLVDLRPTDLKARFRRAEVLHAAKDVPAALAAWRDLAPLLARRGEMGEVARVLEAAVQLAPDDVDLQIRAARARLEVGDAPRALELLADARAARPGDADLDHLQATALIRAGRGAEARPLLLSLADHHRSNGDIEGQARALREALDAGDDDPELRRSADEAADLAGRMRARLWEVPVLTPIHDDEVAACARAEVQARYGFPERALVTLEEALEARASSLPLAGRRVEILLDLQRRQEALDGLAALVRGARGQAREVLVGRLQSLGGPRIPDEEASKADSDLGDGLVEPGVAAPRDAVEQEDARLARVEAHLATGDLESALVLLQDAWRDDPRNEEILRRIGEIRTTLRERTQDVVPVPGAVAPPDPDESEAASSAAEEPTADLAPADGSLEDAWARVSVGLYEEALDAAGTIPGLGGRLVEARALRGTGRGDHARVVLEQALDGNGANPLYPDTLWELADLSLDAGHVRASLERLEELARVAPHWRTHDVTARIRGLKILLERGG
ncbi:MAG: hypothetical protein JXB39_10245 [Deltaproteobacteria bacterium]|nr:hypothetical protein [Deltaproteobacteria bacterium]